MDQEDREHIFVIVLVAVFGTVFGCLLILLLTGCAAPKAKPRALPPLPPISLQPPHPVFRAIVFGSARFFRVAEVVPHGDGTNWDVTLAWSNDPIYRGAARATVIEASPNLIDWCPVYTTPYEPVDQITLTNRPDHEYYRAYTHTIR